MDLTKIDLTEVLAPAAIMVVSVTATTSKGYATFICECLVMFDIHICTPLIWLCIYAMYL